jgi:hypothetical protein
MTSVDQDFNAIPAEQRGNIFEKAKQAFCKSRVARGEKLKKYKQLLNLYCCCNEILLHYCSICNIIAASSLYYAYKRGFVSVH